MKKLLLSSIIMLGICGIASAQNARDARVKSTTPATTNSVTATPQKAASVEQAAIVNADGTVSVSSEVISPEKQAAAQSDARPTTKTATKTTTTTVVLTDAELAAKKKEADEAARTAPVKKDN